MDKLLLAAKLAHARAKEKITQGKMPTFLGLYGMLALMHERIVQFNEAMDNPGSDDTRYILDLAADAITALMLVAPEVPEEEPETTTEQDSTPVDEDGVPHSIDEIPDESTEGLTKIGPTDE